MILDSKNLIYKAVYHGARSLIEVFASLEVRGWENIPAGACLFAANHQSMLDPPLVGSSLPREISFIARRSLFDNPVFGFVIRACHSIPVDRGEADIGAIRSALAALAGGEGLLIFPEGTRSHDGVMMGPKAGAGLLACKSGVPVVPIHIRGNRRRGRAYWRASQACQSCQSISAGRATCYRAARFTRQVPRASGSALGGRCRQPNMTRGENMPSGRSSHRDASSNE